MSLFYFLSTGLPCIEEDELDGISFANVTTLEIRQASDCNSLIQDAFARSTWSRSSKYDNKEIDSSTFLIQFELARVSV